MTESNQPLIDREKLEPLVKEYYDQIKESVLKWSSQESQGLGPQAFLDGLIAKIKGECNRLRKEHPNHVLVIATVAKCLERDLLGKMQTYIQKVLLEKTVQDIRENS